MKPVDQTLFGDGKGNCFAACVASVLEVPLERLPNFCVEYCDPWFARFESWCTAHGVALLSFNFVGAQENVQPFLAWAKVVPLACIVGGDNHDGVKHAVVYHRGELVHDPNPNRRGLVSIDDAVFLVAPPGVSPLLKKLREVA